jgi:hypothetical protein
MRLLRGWVLGAAIAASAIATNTRSAAGASSALPPPARLVVLRAAHAGSCPSEDALLAAVEHRVPRNPFGAAAARTVFVRLRRHGTGFEASVSLVDENGVEHGARVLRTAGPCGDLLEVTALAIAIAVDPHALSTVPAPPATSSPAGASPRRALASAPRRRWRGPCSS